LHQCTRADHVILAAEYRDVFAAARPRLDRAPTIWGSGGAENGALALAAMDTSPLLATERAEVAIDDRALLIHTSGTKGLPKAAISAIAAF
jgi:acyl-coenzyme A synthetase/AMP-(fatty) acid ligase